MSASLTFRLLGVDESASRTLRGVGRAAEETKAKLSALNNPLTKYSAIAALAAQAGGTLTQVIGQAGPAAALAVPAVLTMAQGMGTLKLASDQVKKSFSQLTPQVNQLKKTAGNALAPGLNRFVASLKTDLPVVNVGIRQTASGLSDVAKVAAGSFSGPVFRKELATIMRANATTISNVGYSLVTLGRSFFDVGAVAAPILSEISDSLLTAAYRASDWVSAMGSDRIEQSIRGGLNTIENLGKSVFNILSGVHSLLKAVSRGQGDFSYQLRQGTDAFNRWAHSTRVVNDVAAAFSALRRGAADAFRFVVGGAKDMALGFQNPAFQPGSGVAGFFEHLGQVARQLGDFFRTDLWPAIKSVADLIVNDFGPIIRDIVTQRLQVFMAALGAAARIIRNDVVPIIRNDLVPIIRNDLLPVFDGITRFIRDQLIPAVEHVANVAFEGLRGALSSVKSTIQDNRPQLEALFRILRDVATFVLKVAAPVIGWTLKEAFRLAGQAISAVITTIGWIMRGMQGLANLALLLARVWLDSWHGIADAVLASASAILGVMARLPGPLGAPWRHARDAVRDFKRNLDSDMNGAVAKVSGATAAMNHYMDAIHGKTVTVTVQERHELSYYSKNSPNAPGLTYYASGGQPRAGEWSIVGEQGPELVHFGRDATVFNAGQTAAMTSSGAAAPRTGGVVININVAGHLLGERDFATRIAPTVRDAIVRIARVNGGTSGIR